MNKCRRCGSRFDPAFSRGSTLCGDCVAIVEGPELNSITSPKLVVDSDKFIDLYNAAADIINFCYDDGKGWVGTETIRKSGAFVKLVATLSDAIEPFIPVGTPEDEVE